MATEEQNTIYQWINSKLNLPVYANVYKGAATFVEEKPCGYVNFVSHAVRDIMNGLARTVRGDRRTQVDYVKHMDSISSDWNDHWGNDSGIFNSERLTHYQIPNETCSKIRDLITDHKEGRRRSSESDIVFFTTFLDYSDSTRIPKQFVKEWKHTKDWFMTRTHLRKDAFDHEDEAQVPIHFKKLEEYLFVAASSQFNRMIELDEILEQTNR